MKNIEINRPENLEKQFDIFLRDNEIHFVNPVKDDDKNLIIDFISSLLKEQKEELQKQKIITLETKMLKDKKFQKELNHLTNQ